MRIAESEISLTTLHGFDRGRVERLLMKIVVIFRAIALMLLAISITACASASHDALRFSEASLSARQVQTREFTQLDDGAILSASVAVLQDMGYAIDEVEVELGVLSASKRADATNKFEAFGMVTADAMQCVFTLMLACNRNLYEDIDDVQDIRLTLIAGLQKPGGEIPVRVTMQRIVWDKGGRVSEQETITDARVYEAFFAKFSKAVFLEREIEWTD